MRYSMVAIVLAALALPVGASAQDGETEGEQPLWSQADEYFDPEEMAKAREAVLKESGGSTHFFVIGDRFEVQSIDGEELLLFDAQGWVGGDINKLWVKTEGEYAFADDEFEDAEVQALWSRAITPLFDLQVGVRVDLEPQSRAHLVIGTQGLAPYLFEVDAAAFLSDDGDLTARIEAEYDLRITQRLILQPRGEIELSAQDIPEFGEGAGLSSVELGARLRYDISRQFAPYVGIEWQRDVGQTADFTRAEGGDPERTALIAGVRFWF